MRKSFGKRAGSSDDDGPARKDWVREIHNHGRISGRVHDLPQTGSISATTTTNGGAAQKIVEKPKGVTGFYAITIAPGVDRVFIDEYAAALKADGVNGVICGSLLAEGQALDINQRKELMTAWAGTGMPVIVDISSDALRDVLALASHAQQTGAQAVALSIPSRYPPHDANDAVNYLAEVTHAVSLPVLVHHIPRAFSHGCAPYRLADLLASAIAQGALIRGAIYSSPDVLDFAACVQLASTNPQLATLIHADDATMQAGALQGAKAFASLHFSTVCPLLSKTIAAAQKADASLPKLQSLCATYFTLIAQVGGRSVERCAAATRAITSFRLERDCGSPALPGPRLTTSDINRLRSGMEAFVKKYAASVAPAASASGTAINVQAMAGFNGKLDDKIRSRAEACGRRARISNILSFFPHLGNPHWRKALPGRDCNMARYIDHTILKPEATAAEITKLTAEAVKHGFYAVCVNGCRVDQCISELRGTNVKVAAVIGFPLGAMTLKAKAREARELVQKGALEIDMVMNVGAMKDGDLELVYEDIKAVVEASRPAIVKVIFETCLLTADEIMDASILSVAAGAGFLKTATGFNKGGATPEAIDIMLAVAGNEAEVKASGGVRTGPDALAYITAGVTRIGTSSGVAIVTGGAGGSGY